jgi:hypothetical protein
MNEPTYSRLEEALLSLGFSFHGVEEKNKVFRHEPSGALVIYRDFPASDPVLPRHLLLVRSVLGAYGIAAAGDLPFLSPPAPG